MKNTLIVNNYPICPYCKGNEGNMKVLEADVASVSDERCFEIKMKCRKCDEVSYYFLDLEMNKRISVDKSSVSYKRIVEE